MTKAEYKHQWYLKNKERILAKRAKYYEDNSDKIKKQRLQRHYTDLTKSRTQLKADYVKNKKKYIERATFRQKLQQQRAPKWLSKEQRKELRRFWIECPEGYHVDHIVPLKGKNVSGLHVPWNLQYLLKHDNLSKHNKHESD